MTKMDKATLAISLLSLVVSIATMIILLIKV